LFLFVYGFFLLIKNSAWTTAAVDNERVIAAVPIVMDILNLQKVNLSIQ
jgi:PhoPQ-activated pathogenicity-related protein